MNGARAADPVAASIAPRARGASPLRALSRGPLAGIRIADFTWVGAGSFTTKLLADFGAEVIKIESRERLDSLRLAKPFKDKHSGIERSGYFADRNSSKRSITLNLKHDEGRALARQLIARSDAVANNFTPGTMEKFGLGYADVRAFKADIVYLAMSMQGATGPESHYLGYGLTIGALTGLQHLCGLPDRDPTGTGTNYPDHVPNPCHAAFALLAALRHRRRSGHGQLIDMAQTEPTIALLGPAVLQASANGRVEQRRGNRHRPYAPHGVYPCRGEDRWIAIAAATQTAWLSLLEVLGRPPSLCDDRFGSEPQRVRFADALDAALGEQTRRFDADALMAALQAAQVAAGVVRDARGLLESDAQLAQRGHFVRLTHPEVGPSVYSGAPFRFSGAAGGPQAPAPLLGQHTDEVLRELLGLDAARIAALRADGALQ
jgi:benzylsuccinate CoA-transferase BbsF subunit